MDEEQRAYRRAYDLLEDVQAEDPSGALAQVEAAQVVAHRRGWTRVDLVLQLVAVVHDLVHGPDARTDARVEDLMAQSRHSSQPALVACALGVRGVLRNVHGDTRQMLEDAANALVILDDEELPAQDRATGYTIIAAAYNSLRLWELADELYELAQLAGRHDPEPVMRAALAVNPVIIRVEWALALVEVGDEAEAGRQLERARAALGPARSTPMPGLWSKVREGCACIIDLLTAPGPVDGEAAAANVAVLRRDGDTQMLPLLEAAWVLARYRSARNSREAREVRLAARSALALTGATSPSSSSSTFPAWVRAQVLAGSSTAGTRLRLPGLPARSSALQAQTDHAKLVVQSSWDARRAVLAAAYAQIRVARGRVERERLVHAASTDPLTGLSNRRVFDDWLAGTDAAGSPSGLLLVDVDNFKGVNDTYGHAIGDEVLRALASVLHECEDAGDVSVRLGGDEFAVLVPRMAYPAALAERAVRIAERVLAYPWSTLADDLRVRVSTGASVGGSHDDDTGLGGRLGTYRRADQDLYAGKGIRVRRG